MTAELPGMGAQTVAAVETLVFNTWIYFSSLHVLTAAA